MIVIGKKVRIWLNEFPDIKYIPVETIKLNFPAISNENWGKRLVCLEYYGIVDHSRYGLLGVEFLPQQSKRLEINILVSTDKDISFDSPLIGKYAKIHVGIPKTYADAISRIATDILYETSFPAGILIFGIGAHDEVGSSKFMFVQITRILMSIISKDLKTLTREEIEKIIVTKMNIPYYKDR